MHSVHGTCCFSCGLLRPANPAFSIKKAITIANIFLLRHPGRILRPAMWCAWSQELRQTSSAGHLPGDAVRLGSARLLCGAVRRRGDQVCDRIRRHLGGCEGGRQEPESWWVARLLLYPVLNTRSPACLNAECCLQPNWVRRTWHLLAACMLWHALERGGVEQGALPQAQRRAYASCLARTSTPPSRASGPMTSTAPSPCWST